MSIKGQTIMPESLIKPLHTPKLRPNQRDRVSFK